MKSSKLTETRIAKIQGRSYAIRGWLFGGFILFAVHSHAQDPTVVLSEDWCQCIDTSSLPVDVVMDSCYQIAFDLNREAIREKTPIANDEDQYEAGYRFGYELTQQAMLLMADSCPAFVEIYEDKRHALFRNQDRVALRKELSRLTSDSNQNANRFEKALLYARLHEYDQALALCNEALVINPSDYNALKLTAYIREVRGDFEGAYDIYLYLYELSGDHLLGMDVRIVKQKIAPRK